MSNFKITRASASWCKFNLTFGMFLTFFEIQNAYSAAIIEENHVENVNEITHNEILKNTLTFVEAMESDLQHSANQLSGWIQKSLDSEEVKRKLPLNCHVAIDLLLNDLVSQKEWAV